MKKILKASLLTLSTGFLVACGNGPKEPVAIKSTSDAGKTFIGASAIPQPIDIPDITNPYLAKGGSSTIHSDGYNSDVHFSPAPLGINPTINTRRGAKVGAGMCATITFNKQGQLVALCASLVGFRLELMEPRTLELLATYKLPNRPTTFQALINLDPSIMMTDTSGGAYYYLDEQDRAVLADSQQRIIRLSHSQNEKGQWQFNLDNSWDLSNEVPNDCQDWGNWSPSGECDPITAVMPDNKGLIWWVTRMGRIGTLNPETGKVASIHMKGEEIQNGFSVAEEAVYIVTDHATYALTAGEQDKPKVLWSEQYDRGTKKKVGAINQGSGTTPTLIGERYIAVTDNADERINMLVYRRQPAFNGDRLICTVPLFDKGASATDNSMIGFNRTIIIENNSGYKNAFQQKDWDAIRGGIHRIDIREDESGCDIVWTSKEKAPSVVPKVSADNGLAYFYTFEQVEGEDDVVWYLMAINVDTGKTQFKIRTGAGSAFDNNWAPITIAKDGTAYVGSFKGLMAIWDAPANVTTTH